MLARLDARLDFLVSRHRDTADRHHSLRAALDGSYQVLSPAVRQFCAALSIFRGGWTLEAAEAVCPGDAALTFLTELRDASLIATDETADEMRFRMLDTVREYASEQLAPELREPLLARHADYFARFAECAEPELRGGDQENWLTRLEADQENLRSAMRRSGPAALRIAGALGRCWLVRGEWREGREWLQIALDADTGDSAPATAKACVAGAALAWALDAYDEATLLAERGLRLYEQVNEAWGGAYALVVLGTVAVRRGDLQQATLWLEESLRRFRHIADLWGTAYALDRLAMAARDGGAGWRRLRPRRRTASGKPHASLRAE